MRILYIPFFSNSGNHNGCSIYNVMKVIFRHWVDIDPEVYVYFLLPENFPYQEEEIINHPRIEKIRVRAFLKQHDEKILVPEKLFELFNVDSGEYYYDLVVCDKVQITSWIKMILENKKKEKSRVPYFNFAQFIAKKEGRFKTILDEYEFSCVLGWLSGYNVFQNKRHAERCFEIARKYLKPYWVKKIIENSCVINLFGIDTKVLDKFYKGNSYRKGKELIVNYAHRMATHYNPMFVLNLVDKIFCSGEKIKLVITTPSAGTGTAVRRKINEMMGKGVPIEIYHALPQEKYFEVASRCHFFISAIEETETINSILEQLYLGQVGIFPEVDWVKRFLPGLPFVYKNFNEAYLLIKNFIKNPLTMIQEVVKYRKVIKNEWDIRRNSEKVLAWIKKILPLYKPSSRAIQVTKMILKRAGYPKSFTYEEMKKIFKENSDLGIRIWEEGYRGNNKFDWIKAVKENGYKDTLERVLKFKRCKNVAGFMG